LKEPVFVGVIYFSKLDHANFRDERVSKLHEIRILDVDFPTKMLPDGWMVTESVAVPDPQSSADFAVSTCL